MATNRLDRDTVTRELTQRPKQWQQPELLPEPDQQPGYAYRWVRTSTLGTADPRNISSKTREGWEPVRIEEQPRFALLIDPDSRFKDNIEIGGLLLCRIPEEFLVQRAEYYDAQNKANMESVDNSFMKDNDPRMKKFSERTTKVTFGSGY